MRRMDNYTDYAAPRWEKEVQPAVQDGEAGKAWARRRWVVSSMPMPQSCRRCVMSQARGGDIASWHVPRLPENARWASPVCKPACQVTVAVLFTVGVICTDYLHHTCTWSAGAGWAPVARRLRPVTAAASQRAWPKLKLPGQSPRRSQTINKACRLMNKDPAALLYVSFHTSLYTSILIRRFLFSRLFDSP